jgi:D-alanyl-lipoteichoic acid acyltransferase DltB (MBOAT superfamily)
MEVVGIVQLFAYKVDQKFDSMIAFNDKLANGVWLQFLNFKDINNIAELYNRLKDSPSRWRISSRTDGHGFSLQVSSKA